MAKGGNGIPLVGHWNGDPLDGFVETETAGANPQGMDGDIVPHGFFHDSSYLGTDVLSRFHPCGPRDEDSGQGSASAQLRSKCQVVLDKAAPGRVHKGKL